MTNFQTDPFSTPSRTKPTIAAFTSTLTSPYQTNLFLGMADFAEANELNMLCISGGALRSPDSYISMRNVLYDIINPGMLDGLIVLSSSLSRFISKDEFMVFLKRYHPVKIVCVGAKIGDYPVVKPDYKKGMRTLLEHLIKDHGYRRIALVRGPEFNLSSEERFLAYQEVLSENGIIYDPRLVVYEDLKRNVGGNAIKQLIDERNVTFDALVTVNDSIALSVIEALKQRRIKVPNDVAVVGYQGAVNGMISSPTLTTVSEAMYNQGWDAAQLLYVMIQGQNAPGELLTPTRLICRESCGCLMRVPDLNLTENGEGKLFSQIYNVSQDSIIQYMNKEAEIIALASSKSVINSIYFREVFDAFRHFLSDSGNVCALQNVRMVLEKTIIDAHDLTMWSNALLVMRRELTAVLFDETEKKLFEQFWFSIQMMLIEKQQKMILSKDFRFQKLIDLFRQILYNLRSRQNLTAVTDFLTELLEINHCYIVLFEGKQLPSELSKVLMVYKDRNLVEITEEQSHFPAKTFLPREWLPENRYTLIVEPLYFWENHLGYMLIDMGIREGAVYEALQVEISSALMNEIRMTELHSAEQRFSDIALSSSDWLWEVNSDLRFTYCSDGVYDVMGFTAQEMMGKTLFDFVVPDEKSYLTQLKENIIPHRLPIVSLESWNVHRDGRKVALVISGTPILNDELQLLGYRGVFKDVTEQKRAEERVKYLAYYDVLTGLPNRTLFMDRLQMELAHAKRDQTQLAVMFLDLDNFKYVNDTLGHAAGDQLLKNVADRLQKCLRSTDTIARLGGDEFTILATFRQGSNEPQIINEKILKVLSQPFCIKDSFFNISTSIGVAIFPCDGNDSEELVKNADMAMYKAKENGKNGYVFFNRNIRKSIS